MLENIPEHSLLSVNAYSENSRMTAWPKKPKIRFPRKGRWEYLSEDNVTVSSYGIPEVFQQAFLKIFVDTKRLYLRLFGNHVIGHVEFNVRKSTGNPHRLWTNGADRVFLTLSRKSQLEPASISGVRNLHGLTHELAHIVLYRSLVNLSCLPTGWGEGWAVYLASFYAVPYLFRRLGPTLWPYPHDFLQTDGPSLYLQKFANGDIEKMHPTVRVVRQLYLLEQQLGQKRFVSLIRHKLAAPIRADEFAKEMDDFCRKRRIRMPPLP